MFTVKINFNPSQVIRARGLNKNGSAQQYFTNEVWKHSDKYVPYERGALKSNVDINSDNLVYRMKYARRQYFTNKGNGIDGINRGGLRGPRWADRCWAIEGNEILKDVASKIGGHL